MASKLINLLALSTLAILATSFGSANVNALSVSPNHHARSLAHQALVAKKRATASGRPKCKPRPSSSAPAAPAGTPAAPAKPAPAPAQGNPTPAPASSGGKGLLAWGAAPDAQLYKNLKVGQVSALHNWNPQPPSGAEAAGYEFVPTYWGAKDTDYVRNSIKPGQYKHIIGFNEPDHGEQGNMDPGTAAALYKEIMVPLHNGGTRVGSPGVSNGPGGIDWFNRFVAACGSLSACGIDFISVHCYSTDTSYVQTTIQDWNKKYNLPLWVTEFAAMDFVTYQKTDVPKFAAEMASWLKSQNYIEKYSPFMIADSLGNVDMSNMIISGNSFNSLGWTYFG